MERQNSNGVNDKLSSSGAATAAIFVRNSLISRITLLVAGAYALSRSKDDLNVRRAFFLMRDPATRREVEQRGSPLELTAAEAQWTACGLDARLGPVKTFRDKYTAHTTDVTDLPVPRYDELFPFALATTTMMGKLALGTGARSEDVSIWNEEVDRSAMEFWAPWSPLQT